MPKLTFFIDSGLMKLVAEKLQPRLANAIFAGFSVFFQFLVMMVFQQRFKLRD